MSIVYQTNKQTGITYAYENEAYWNKEKQQSRARRKLIGKLDPETGEIVPTRSYNKHVLVFCQEKGQVKMRFSKSIRFFIPRSS